MKLLFSLFIFCFCGVAGIAQTKKVIFVCEHGAARSVIAATYFNKLAKERNLDWEGVCRGTSPDSTLTAGTVEGLKKDNLFDTKLKPQKLSLGDTTGAERIILFTNLPAEVDSDIPVEDWSILNVETDYAKRRDAIIKKLNILLDSLEKHK